MWLNLRAPVLPRLGVTPLRRSRIAAPTLKKNQAGLLRARSLHGARGTSARAASVHSLEGWFDVRDLGAVQDPEGPCFIRQRSDAVAPQDHKRRVEAKSRHCSKGSIPSLDIISSNMSYIDQNALSAKRMLERLPLCLWHLSVAEVSGVRHGSLRPPRKPRALSSAVGRTKRDRRSDKA